MPIILNESNRTCSYSCIIQAIVIFFVPWKHSACSCLKSVWQLLSLLGVSFPELASARGFVPFISLCVLVVFTSSYAVTVEVTFQKHRGTYHCVDFLLFLFFLSRMSAPWEQDLASLRLLISVSFSNNVNIGANIVLPKGLFMGTLLMWVFWIRHIRKMN